MNFMNRRPARGIFAKPHEILRLRNSPFGRIASLRMTAIIVLVFIFHLSSFIFSAKAQEVDLSARAHLSDVLNKPLSPRAAAMGNAFVAMKDDPNTLFSNPAAISTIVPQDSERLNEISASYSHYVLDINEGAIVYEHPVPEGF